ncbi:penicillin-binding transpeptidase domain-containing protein [Hwanghaeella grinnelliae]|nr:penicillin-binding transpeptidase domain-containing protein [Hwanghaeella grinnelliae]
MILRATKNDGTDAEERVARSIGAPETRVEPRLTKKDRTSDDASQAQPPRKKLIIERREPEQAAQTEVRSDKRPERARAERKGFSVRAKIAPARSKSAPTERKTPVAADTRRPSFGKDGAQRDGVFRSAMETGRTRLLITGTVITLAFAVIGARLVDVTAMRAPTEPASKVAATVPAPKSERAGIVDRNGVLLATNLSTVSLIADPKYVQNPRETAYKLAAVLPTLDPKATEDKLRKKSRFVPLMRTLTPQQQYDVNALGLPGIDFDRKQTRIYPHGPLFGHILGQTDTDNNGIAGLELRFDTDLQEGTEPLQLSLDVRVQHMLREELGAAISKFSAVGGAAIVMDVHNGEVLGMVSLPDFDPNEPIALDDESLFNRATKGVYELGSTFKIFNTALGLESGSVSLTSSYDATKPIRVGRFNITDYHAKNRWLSVPEIFIYSSNIGSAKMALDVGGPEQKRFFDKIGFLKPLDVEVPEVGYPQSPAVWRPVNTMTISFGHGLAVSPLHLATGVSAMVNGGTLYRPTVLKATEAPHGKRVISEKTSNAIRALMHLNGIEGSGKNAQAEGYVVGGKTGTAEKAVSGGYRGKSLISSFVGAFPMHAPRYTVYVVLDEPHGIKETYGYATGGWVAAPVVGNVVRRLAPMMGIKPTDADAPEVRQHFAILPPQMGASLASLRQ